MRRNIKMWISMILLVGIMATVYFGGTIVHADEAEDTFTVAFCIEQLANSYLKKVADNMEKYAEEAGLDLTIYDAEQTLEKQLSHIDTAIAQKVDVIVLTPVDADGMVPGVEAANKAGIPLICLCNSVSGGEYSMCGSQQPEAGAIQAEYLAEVLPDDAKVLYMRGIEGLLNTEERATGFSDKLAELRPDVTILAQQSAEYARDKAMQLMEDWIQAYPEFDAVVAANDDMALGAKDALKAANRLDGVYVCGIDALDETLQAIVDGEIAQTVLQDAEGQAKQAIELCKLIRDGETPEAEYMVPFKSIYADNVEEFLG